MAKTSKDIPKPEPYPLGLLIRKRIAYLEINASEAARRVGVSRQVFAYWLSGRSRPRSPTVANKLRLVLKVPAEEWIGVISKERGEQ